MQLLTLFSLDWDLVNIQRAASEEVLASIISIAQHGDRATRFRVLPEFFATMIFGESWIKTGNFALLTVTTTALFLCMVWRYHNNIINKAALMWAT